MTSEVLNTVERIRRDGGPSQAWITPYQRTDAPGTHQFVLFLKPEVTATQAGVRMDKVLQLIEEALDNWAVDLGAARVLRGDYLEAHRVMDRHYGVINRLSHEGRKALTPEAEAKLQEHFAGLLDDGAEVLGGHEFLAAHPAFTAESLCVLSDNVGSTKLGGGTYALQVHLHGKPYLLIDAFHPWQLEPFYRPSNVLVVLEGRSAKPWADLRRQLAGATNPRKAADGSLRNLFLEHQQDLGLADVSQGANGIHLSAGPLEGMVEVQRFFSDDEAGTELNFADTCFAQRLVQEGLNLDQVVSLAANPMLKADGQDVSAFDLTEEKDAGPSAELLARALRA